MAEDAVNRTMREAGFDCALELVPRPEGFQDALRTFAPDVVLAGPESVLEAGGGPAMRLLRATVPTAPLIVLAETCDERVTVACVRAGAESIVDRHRLEGLAPAIREGLAVRDRLRRLTRRQIEVLRLVAEGNTTKEIARILRRSIKTVEAHRTEVMRRLGSRDGVDLVRYAVRVGLIPVNR